MCVVLLVVCLFPPCSSCYFVAMAGTTESLCLNLGLFYFLSSRGESFKIVHLKNKGEILIIVNHESKLNHLKLTQMKCIMIKPIFLVLLHHVTIAIFFNFCLLFKNRVLSKAKNRKTNTCLLQYCI